MEEFDSLFSDGLIQDEDVGILMREIGIYASENENAIDVNHLAKEFPECMRCHSDVFVFETFPHKKRFLYKKQ